MKIAQNFLQSFILLFTFFFPVFAHAALLSVVPDSSTISVGSNITIYVVVDSEGVAINASQGTLSFPREFFDVVSVGKSTSLFSVWVQAPTYDGDHSISFNGGLPSPGYNGSNGQLFTVVLRAKAVGSTDLVLINSVVRANDGNGTDVLRYLNNARINIKQPVILSPKPTVPIITSNNATTTVQSSGTSSPLNVTSMSVPITKTSSNAITPLFITILIILFLLIMINIILWVKLHKLESHCQREIKHDSD